MNPNLSKAPLFGVYKEFRLCGQREDLDAVLQYLVDGHREEVETVRKASLQSRESFWKFFKYPPIEDGALKVLSETVANGKDEGVLDLEYQKDKKRGRVILQKLGPQWRIVSENWRDFS